MPLVVGKFYEMKVGTLHIGCCLAKGTCNKAKQVKRTAQVSKKLSVLRKYMAVSR